MTSLIIVKAQIAIRRFAMMPAAETIMFARSLFRQRSGFTGVGFPLPMNGGICLAPPMCPITKPTIGIISRVRDRVGMSDRIQGDATKQACRIVAKFVRHPGVRRFVCRDRKKQHHHVDNEIGNQLFCAQSGTRGNKMQGCNRGVKVAFWSVGVKTHLSRDTGSSASSSAGCRGLSCPRMTLIRT